MQARSVVFDLFGDYIRDEGGRIPLQKLARLMDCFGVGLDSTRVIMSRVTREGWFRSTRHGRESTYEPTERGWELLDTGLARIMARPNAQEWDGRWYMAVFSVPESKRGMRAQLKTSLAWLGFASTSAGVWISPNDRLNEAESVLQAEPSVKYELFESRSRGPISDFERAAKAWDLTALARDYEEFARRCAGILAAGTGALSGREALVMRTELIHSYRLFLFRDPNLPLPLLPSQWPAGPAFEAVMELSGELRPKAKAYFSELTAT